MLIFMKYVKTCIRSLSFNKNYDFLQVNDFDVPKEIFDEVYFSLFQISRLQSITMLECIDTKLLK